MRFSIPSLVLVGVASCQVYDQSLLEGGSGGNAGSAGAGGAATVECSNGECFWSRTNEEDCRTAGVPTPEMRPDPAGLSTNELPPFYLGIQSLRLGTFDEQGQMDEDAWQAFGFDLDGVCTNSATCDNMRNQQPCMQAVASPMVPFDGQLCRDNTFARLQPIAAAVPELGALGITETDINCGLWNGAYTIMSRISGYNGSADDDLVRVDYYIGLGTTLPPGWTCPNPNFRNEFPRWLSSNPWRVADAELTGPVVSQGALPDSRLFDDAAYVRDGYLVARIPDGANMDIAGGPEDPFLGFDIILHGGVFSGRLDQEQDGTWNIRDGVMGGRILGDDLTQSFRNLGFCEEQPLFVGVANFIIQNSDTLLSGAVDPAAVCDAMSIGLSFEAGQLTPGPAEPRTPRPGCPPLGMGGAAGAPP